MNLCPLCKKEFNDADFLKHIKKDEKYFLSDFFSKYIGKKDLQSGELIPFKTLDQYRFQDFLNRKNFVYWVQKNIKEDKDKTLKYCYKKLQERVDNKKLKYAPSHVELSSLNLLNTYEIEIFDSLDNYLKFCTKNKLVERFDYNIESFGRAKKKFDIFTDSREKTPLELSVCTEIIGLNVGDYSSSVSNVVIERKSQSDLWGTLCKNISRFEKEICRAKEQGKYLVVLVEKPLYYCLDYKPNNFTKTNPAFVFHRIRAIMQKFDNIQFLFCENREDAAELTVQLLTYNEEKIKRADLQYLREKGVI